MAPDAIAEARKEFETIKSVREAALLPESRMPKLGVPELSLPTTPSAVSGPKPKQNPRDPKSSNWLVDAMAKETNTSAGRTPESRSKERKARSNSKNHDDGSRGEGARGFEARESAAAGSEREQRDEREEDVTAAVVVNPLNAFLGEWMTPQDYALLKPGLTPKEGSGVAGNVAGLPGSLGVTLPGNGLKDLSFGGPVASSNPPPTSPRENPYLQSLKPDAAVTSTLNRSRPTETSMVPNAPRQAPMVAPTPPVTPPPSKIPEFAKPPTDDRYFKQLKRF